MKQEPWLMQFIRITSLTSWSCSFSLMLFYSFSHNSCNYPWFTNTYLIEFRQTIWMHDINSISSNSCNITISLEQVIHSKSNQIAFTNHQTCLNRPKALTKVQSLPPWSSGRWLASLWGWLLCACRDGSPAYWSQSTCTENSNRTSGGTLYCTSARC